MTTTTKAKRKRKTADADDLGFVSKESIESIARTVSAKRGNSSVLRLVAETVPPSEAAEIGLALLLLSATAGKAQRCRCAACVFVHGVLAVKFMQAKVRRRVWSAKAPKRAARRKGGR